MSEDSCAGWRKFIPDLDSTSQRTRKYLINPEKYLSRKYMVDNSECPAITITEKGLRKSKIRFFILFILFKVVYCDLHNSNPMLIFVDRDWKTSIIRNRIRCARFHWGRLWWVYLSTFGASLQSHAACNRCNRAPQSFVLIGKN